MNTERINVLWDIENCAVPSGVAANQIAGHIRNALASANLHGPITLSAYGDVQMHLKSVQQALADTNIYFKNIPNDRKEAADKAIIVDIFLWALDNPPPAHIFLISGDRDFSNALHGLKNRRYNVLLASLNGLKVSQSLTGAASTIWDWGKLARGQFVTIDRSDFAVLPAKDKQAQPVLTSPTAAGHGYQIRNLNPNASTVTHSSDISINTPKQLYRPSGSISEHQRVILGVADVMATAQSVLEASIQQQLRTPAFVEPARGFQLEGHALHGVRRSQGGMTEEHRRLLQITMDSLRVDAVMPNREHLHIRFHQVAQEELGVSMHSTQIELLLEAALMQQVVECVRTAANNSDVYFLHGGQKWKYQDPLDERDPYEPLIWEALLIFLQRDAKTQNGAILTCHSRLQAAEYIKAVASHYLQSLPVGVLMHLLQLAAKKNWIVTESPASRLWGRPMAYNLPLLTYHTKTPPTPKHTQQGPLIPDLPRLVSASPLLAKPYKEQRSEAVSRSGALTGARKGSEDVASTGSLLGSCLPTPKPTVQWVPVKGTGSGSGSGREEGVNVELEFRRWLALSFGSKGKLRGGVVLGGLLSLFKAATGLVVDWKSWGFARESVFLQSYPDLILVITSPPPGKVVPAASEARIDLEALLGQVLPAGGKQGLPLNLLPKLFWNAFGYSIDKKLGEGQGIRAVLESMTQVVEVREEGAEVTVHQASGDATWRFCRAANGVGGVGGKGSTPGAQSGSGRASVAVSSSVAVVRGGRVGGVGGPGGAGQQGGGGILGRGGMMTWQQKLMAADENGSESRGKGAEGGGEGWGESNRLEGKDGRNGGDALSPPHTESTKVEVVASEREEGQGRGRMEKGTGGEECRGDEGDELTESDTGETFFAMHERVVRTSGVERRRDNVKKVETQEIVEVGGSSDIVTEGGGFGSRNVAGEVEKPTSIETQRIVIIAREDDRDGMSELNSEEVKIVVDDEKGRQKEREIEVPPDFGSEVTPNAGISYGGGSPLAFEHPLEKLLGLLRF